MSKKIYITSGGGSVLCDDGTYGGYYAFSEYTLTISHDKETISFFESDEYSMDNNRK